MNRQLKSELGSFVGEALLYTAVLLGYFAAVLHFLGGWLEHLFVAQRQLYALLTVALLVGQGLFLEELTRHLSRLLRRRRPPAGPAGRS